MSHSAKGLICATLMACASAAPVSAQEGAPSTDQPDAQILGGDRIIVGAGIAAVPSYIGSKSVSVVPTVAIQGQISGISFNSQGTSLYVDAIPNRGVQGWKLQAGPMLSLRLDRNSFINGTQVEKLGKLKKAWEPGAWIGIQRTGVITSPYDTLSLNLSYQHDISNAHGSYIVSPSIDYDTPLSRTAYASISLSADYVGKGFGAYYYDIDTAGSDATGLPAYDGASKAGWKDWNLSATIAHSLTGDLTHGLSLFATGGYARILGAYRRSPIVDIAGSPNQWSGAIGLAYIF